MDIPKPKIEDRAIRALENIIDEHLTMQSQFNRMDKEMSWDGYIWIFQKCGGQNKENFDDKVPVQIKGHIDKEQKYINKTRITYSVKITDLKVYFRDRGILYFEIFMSEDGKRREIFYSSLFPSKLKSYIETAEKKGNKEYINISFSKLEKTANKLYIIVKQFSNESRKQGFGIGPTVQNTIMVKDMEKVTSITASAVGVANRYEFLQRLSEGDVCLYGTLEGCPISFPLEWYDNSTYVLREKIHQTFGIENRVFYEEYEVETTSNDSIILIPSENLEIDLTKGKFRFKENSSIKQLRIDAEFLLCAMQNTNFTIGNTNFQYGKLNMPKTLEDKLEFYIQLDDVLQMIEFNFEKPFKSLSKQTKQQLVSIVAMKNGLYNKDLTDQRHIFNWKIEDKYMPVIVSRHDNDEKNDLMNAIYTRKHQTFDTDEKGHYFRVPLFVIIDRHILDNLYYYDNKKNGEVDYLIDDVYAKCKEQQGRPKEEMVNHVKEIYAPFTDEEISNKIARMITGEDVRAEVKVVFQTVSNLHRACPRHSGDWYFTGDYPTPGGNKVVNTAYINWMEGRNERSY